MSYWWVLRLVILLIILITLFKWFIRLFGILIIPDDSIRIVTKKFVLFGNHRRLPDGSLIAINGEAGIQVNTLAPGLHGDYWPWQFKINIQKFITINEGMVGVVESRDGQPIQPGRVFAKSVQFKIGYNEKAQGKTFYA